MNLDLGVLDPFDIDSAEFNPDLYLNKMLKEKHLPQLMEKEQQLYKQIQSLDSEMQTLVYENYNKFISATETIRKMSSKFDKMEEELDLLTANMDQITGSSELISDNLKDRRQQLSKLTSTHTVLKKLQFLFELSPRMQSNLNDGSFNDAVRSYLQAEKALEQYRHFPSIQAIDQECQELLIILKQRLYEQFSRSEASQQELADSTKLLLQLQEAPVDLASKFLSFSGKRLEGHFVELDYQINLYGKSLTVDPRRKDDATGEEASPMDVLEFVDTACSGFLSNLTNLILSYETLFLQAGRLEPEDSDQLREQLSNFVNNFIGVFLKKVSSRIELEKPIVRESNILVRALDRFYCRLTKLRKVYPKADFSRRALEIVTEASRSQCKNTLEHLKLKFTEALTSCRTSIVNASTSGDVRSQGKLNLCDLLTTMQSAIGEMIKIALAGLTSFVQPDVVFVRENPRLQFAFVRNVRENVIVSILKHIMSTAEDFQKSGFSSTIPATLIAVLSRLCLDMESTTISYLLTLVDEQFNIRNERDLTTCASLGQMAHESAQKLIDYYVKLEGNHISQMIRKSVETRDWLGTVEPRSVRSVVKRVVEDVTSLETQVGQLFVEGSRLERSSDSSRSRRTFSVTGMTPGSVKGHRRPWSSYGASTIDNNLMTNIQKLFSEKIEIFAHVDFSKLSIVTGIIKIGLKTLVECVRLCTFSKFGLQQVQVDAFFLQTHLWRFVSDENLVHSLLDEVLVSSIHRCLDPVLMEMSIVEKICEGL